ncbi:MAG: hypothetical protein JOZ51_02505, partial [Chloroflexi bacterium]|nr:hypothetical protein [Chloroflexota bacterium]
MSIRLFRCLGLLVLLTLLAGQSGVSAITIAPKPAAAPSGLPRLSQQSTLVPRSDDFGINNVIKGGQLLGTGALNPQRLDRAKTLGTGWNRVVLAWYDVEPYNDIDNEQDPDRWGPQEPCTGVPTAPIPMDRWLWPEYDQTVNNARLQGIETLFVLQGVPQCWQISPSNRRPVSLGAPIFQTAGGPSDSIANATGINPANGWAHYVFQAVVRYGDRVTYWQVWNEVNGKFWESPSTPQEFARMVEVTYWAAKYASQHKNRPDVQLVMPGMEDYSPGSQLSQRTIDLLNTLNQTSAISSEPYLKYFSIFAAHGYNIPWRTVE